MVLIQEEIEIGANGLRRVRPKLRAAVGIGIRNVGRDLRAQRDTYITWIWNIGDAWIPTTPLKDDVISYRTRRKVDDDRILQTLHAQIRRKDAAGVFQFRLQGFNGRYR